MAAESDLQKIFKGTKLSDPARYLDIVSPLRTEVAALSPDGRMLAYTVRNNDDIFLYVVDVDRPEVLKTKALVYTVAPTETGVWWRGIPKVRWLHWTSSNRLVIETNKDTSYGSGEIIAINADGSNALILANSEGFPEFERARAISPHIRAIGPDPDHPDSIIIAAHRRFYDKKMGSVSLNKDVLDNEALIDSAYRINVLTGERTPLSRTIVESFQAKLLDGRGRVRILVDRSALGIPQALRAALSDDPKDRPTLDQVTGLKGFTFSMTGTLFGGRSVPLGFDTKGEVLYYASNVGRNTFGVYAFDLKTKQRLPSPLEMPAFDLLSPQLGTLDALQFYRLLNNEDDEPSKFWLRWRSSRQLVMDRFTQRLAGVRYEGATRTALWLRPELQAVQDWLATNRPGRSAEILEWDESLNRFLVREQAPADPGAFYLLDRKQGTYREFARRGPDPEGGAVAQLTPFAFTLPDGSKIDGLIALPRDSKVKRIPLVLLCPDQPWQHRGAEYLPEFEALTRMGLAVALYNGRGTWGTGLKERQKLMHGAEEVQVADMVAIADYLAEKFDVSRNRVALLGKDQGGFVALRALQLQPDRFRCAVTIDARLLASARYDTLLYGKAMPEGPEDRKRAVSTPLSEHPELIKRPVLTIANRLYKDNFHANARLHAAIQNHVPASEFLDLDAKTAELPETQARQWARIESFLNYVLYDYVVNLGETEFLPDKPPEPARL